MVSRPAVNLVAFLVARCIALGTEAGVSPATATLAAATTDSLPPDPTSGSTKATPLPPLPTGNHVCAFEDLDTLIDRVIQDWTGYNISLFVKTCPNACEVAFGLGNPNVSGPGVSSLLVAGMNASNDM
jgi:hypothetical protein